MTLRPSNSAGNLTEKKQYLTEEQQTLLRHMRLANNANKQTNSVDKEEKKMKLKRTKSFWRFGKHNSDHDILEGMSMWKHRDLVDVTEKPIVANNTVHKNIENTQEHNGSSSHGTGSGSEKSVDSDKTINAKQSEETGEEIYGMAETMVPPKRGTSFNSKQQKLSLLVRKDSETGYEIEYEDNNVIEKKQITRMNNQNQVQDEFDDDFENNPRRRMNKTKSNNNKNDQFYDDEGDGLMLRTVNRKDILKQYSNNDSIGSDETESESEMTSDDPYDCIVVDDHTTLRKQKGKRRRNNNEDVENENNTSLTGTVEREKFPNVAEIGKKLEQFSKSNKYSPDNKDSGFNKEQYRNSMNNKINGKMNTKSKERNNNNNENGMEMESHQEILMYRNNNRNSQQLRSPSPEPRHSFKTFGIEDDSANMEKQTPQPESRRKPRNYSENESGTVEKNRRRNGKYASNQETPADREKPSGDKKRRTENRHRAVSDSERVERKKEKYYPEREEDPQEEFAERQFLPRTKLVKTNSATMQTVLKYEQEIVEYGDMNVKNKKGEYGAKYEEMGPNNGNIYGPWYDLWGLDATVQNK